MCLLANITIFEGKSVKKIFLPNIFKKKNAQKFLQSVILETFLKNEQKIPWEKIGQKKFVTEKFGIKTFLEYLLFFPNEARRPFRKNPLNDFCE